MRQSVLSYTLCFVSLLASCGSDPLPAEPESTQTELVTNDPTPVTYNNPEGNTAVLPPRSGYSDCVEENAELPVCDWVAGTDVIVYGVVRDLARFETPMAGASSREEMSVCPEDIVEGGISVTLEVTAGSDLELVGDTITARVGPRAHYFFNEAEAGEPLELRRGPKIGDGLGMALIYDAELDVYTPVRALLFTFGEDGLEAGVEEHCMELFPRGLRGATWDEFETAISSCETGGDSFGEREALKNDPALGTHAICYGRAVQPAEEDEGR